MRARLGRAAAASVMVGGLVLLAGCGGDSDSISQQARQGDNKGFIAGDGRIETLPADERKQPIALSGTQIDGKAWDVASERGKIVVLNVWGAWCGPCQKELPDLQEVWSQAQTKKQPVQFMGLDQRDSVPAAAATLKRFGITYPSLRDDGGRSLLALQGKAATTPTTLLLDRQGRISARVSGPVSAGTLRGLIEDAVQEKSTG